MAVRLVSTRDPVGRGRCVREIILDTIAAAKALAAAEPAAVALLARQLDSPDEGIAGAAARALLASAAVNRKLALEHGVAEEAIDVDGDPVQIVRDDEAQAKARAWLARKRLGAGTNGSNGNGHGPDAE